MSTWTFGSVIVPLTCWPCTSVPRLIVNTPLAKLPLMFPNVADWKVAPFGIVSVNVRFVASLAPPLVMVTV